MTQFSAPKDMRWFSNPLKNGSGLAAFSESKKTARPHISRPRSAVQDFPLVDSNASIQQVAAVVVAIVERDAKQSWRRQRAVGSDDRERYRAPIVGPTL